MPATSCPLSRMPQPVPHNKVRPLLASCSHITFQSRDALGTDFSHRESMRPCWPGRGQGRREYILTSPLTFLLQRSPCLILKTYQRSEIKHSSFLFIFRFLCVPKEKEKPSSTGKKHNTQYFSETLSRGSLCENSPVVRRAGMGDRARMVNERRMRVKVC